MFLLILFDFSGFLRARKCSIGILVSFSVLWIGLNSSSGLNTVNFNSKPKGLRVLGYRLPSWFPSPLQQKSSVDCNISH